MAKNEQDKEIEGLIAKAVKEALETAIPAAAAGIAKAQNQAQQELQTSIRASKPSGDKCNICRQMLPAGKTAETHPHRKMVVYPSNPRLAKWWQGIMLNGVYYSSNNSNHKITVPADVNFEYIIQEFEKNEEEQQQGRFANHDSGALGPGGTPNKAEKGWR